MSHHARHNTKDKPGMTKHAFRKANTGPAALDRPFTYAEFKKKPFTHEELVVWAGGMLELIKRTEAENPPWLFEARRKAAEIALATAPQATLIADAREVRARLEVEGYLDPVRH